MVETPFVLTYGSETVISVEVKMPSYRVQHYNEDSNNKRLEDHINLLEERREKIETQMTTNKGKLSITSIEGPSPNFSR